MKIQHQINSGNAMNWENNVFWKWKVQELWKWLLTIIQKMEMQMHMNWQNYFFNVPENRKSLKWAIYFPNSQENVNSMNWSNYFFNAPENGKSINSKSTCSGFYGSPKGIFSLFYHIAILSSLPHIPILSPDILICLKRFISLVF